MFADNDQKITIGHFFDLFSRFPLSAVSKLETMHAGLFISKFEVWSKGNRFFQEPFLD